MVIGLMENGMRIILQTIFFLMMATTSFAADKTYLGVKSVVIIDVRTPPEFAQGHVEGAINCANQKRVLQYNTMIGS